jgi:hypothetical protein
LGSGVVLNAVGIATYTSSSTDYWTVGGDEDAKIAGIAMIVAGELCLVASVPMFIIGGSKRNRAVRNLKRQYDSSQSALPHLQLNVYPGRVGMAYVF